MYSLTREKEKDYDVLYPEQGEDRIIRKEQEDFASKARNRPLGAICTVSAKVRGAFKVKRPAEKRMKTYKVDVNSKAFKDYQEKKISFAEMKRICRIV